MGCFVYIHVRGHKYMYNDVGGESKYRVQY